MMDGNEQKHRDEKETDRKGAEARKELDEVPPPGTDPLHEGP
jgi:hypothetical protein